MNGNDGVNEIKCVFVGDRNVGKTAALVSTLDNDYEFKDLPRVLEERMCTVPYENHVVELCLMDTSIGNEYDEERISKYRETDVVLIFYSLVDPESLQNVEEKWLKEIKKETKNNDKEVIVIMVGTKLDLREDTYIEKPKELIDLEERRLRPVIRVEGEKVAKENNVDWFCECSSKTQKGLKEVFEAVARCIVEKNERRSKKEKCTIQ